MSIKNMPDGSCKPFWY